jgi:hypothetical protein
LWWRRWQQWTRGLVDTTGLGRRIGLNIWPLEHLAGQRKVNAAGWCASEATRSDTSASSGIAPHLECAQIFFRQVQHADDARGEHENDVGLLALVSGVAEQAPDTRDIT